jgi:nitrogen regulatory protein PII
MKKIEAIIRPSRFEDVRQALSILGIDAFTICDVRGGVMGARQTLSYRCQAYSIDVMPQMKIEVVVGARLADEVIQAVIEAAHTGSSDDGQVFVSEVSEAIRICNYQRDEAAV